MKVFASLGFFILLAAACAPTQPETVAAVPDDQTACEASGGSWIPQGRAQIHRCVVVYADAGRPCRGSSDCQGECRLPQPLRADPPPGPITGFCQEASSPFGCYTRVENGRVEATLCVD